MLAKPKVTVAVATDGTVKVSVEGAPGATCRDVTRAVEAALGETVADVPTAEMTSLKSTQAATLRQNGS